MARVKICGVTRVEDALAAEAAGADAVGLIFWPGSKRFVSPGRAAEISSALGPMIGRVGVFKDADVEDVLAAASALRLTAVQLHGDEDAVYASALREQVAVIRAFAVGAAGTLDDLREYPADGILLDAPTPGSGRTFAWDAASALKGFPRLIVAGGLTADNVSDAIDALEPYGVDVASGVELSPGIKHPELIHAFVRAAKQRDFSTVIHSQA